MGDYNLSSGGILLLKGTYSEAEVETSKGGTEKLSASDLLELFVLKREFDAELKSISSNIADSVNTAKNEITSKIKGVESSVKAELAAVHGEVNSIKQRTELENQHGKEISSERKWAIGTILAVIAISASVFLAYRNDIAALENKIEQSQTSVASVQKNTTSPSTAKVVSPAKGKSLPNKGLKATANSARAPSASP